MSTAKSTPELQKLRRDAENPQTQIQSHTADLEKVNQSLRHEIASLKDIAEELKIRLSSHS